MYKKVNVLLAMSMTMTLQDSNRIVELFVPYLVTWLSVWRCLQVILTQMSDYKLFVSKPRQLSQQYRLFSDTILRYHQQNIFWTEYIRLSAVTLT